MPGDFSQRVLVFDTETTGLDVASDRICELGAAYFERGVFVERRRMLINPQIPIPPAATRVHRIRDSDVADKGTFAEVASAFITHLTGQAMNAPAPILAGYNACEYDVAILNAEFARAGVHFAINPLQVVDPVVAARWHLRHLRPRRLENICRHYGIDLSRAHSADADARATGEVLFAMIADGFIPDHVDAALEEQRRIVPILEDERRWTYWLYRDRITGDLRIGAGKHIGSLLAEADPSYLVYLLNNVDDLPETVAIEFRDVLSNLWSPPEDAFVF